MRPFLAYATNGASTLNALIEGADFISRCRCTARRGIGVSCVTAKHEICAVCNNAASDIAAAMAKNFKHSALFSPA